MDGDASVALTEAGMVIAELAILLARLFAHLVQAIFYGVAFFATAMP